MTTAPKPFAFVLMPFSQEFDDTYELAIRPACESAGAYAERVDEQIFTGSILDRVYNQISKADLIVADMSGRNPNVFYEVGYAHALGKTAILVTNTADDIPFDLKHYPHIIYNDRLADLKKKLESRISWHLQNPEKKIEKSRLLIRVDGVVLNSHAEIEKFVSKDATGLFFKIEIQNTVETSIGTESFRVGFFVPSEFLWVHIAHYSSSSGIDVGNSRNLFFHPEYFSVLPEAWVRVDFRPSLNGAVAGRTYDFVIRIYRESGAQDYPFSVKVVSE